MSKTKDVQEQVETILQEQISLLRVRAKECSRQFNHQRYDEITAQYIVLETKLKALIASKPKSETIPESRADGLQDVFPVDLSGIDPLPSTEEAVEASMPTSPEFNWSRVRHHQR